MEFELQASHDEDDDDEHGLDLRVGLFLSAATDDSQYLERTSLTPNFCCR